MTKTAATADAIAQVNSDAANRRWLTEMSDAVGAEVFLVGSARAQILIAVGVEALESALYTAQCLAARDE